MLAGCMNAGMHINTARFAAAATEAGLAAAAGVAAVLLGLLRAAFASWLAIPPHEQVLKEHI
jgi:hypothetical protein